MVRGTGSIPINFDGTRTFSRNFPNTTTKTISAFRYGAGRFTGSTSGRPRIVREAVSIGIITNTNASLV